jgi:FkbM family methyltransferase
MITCWIKRPSVFGNRSLSQIASSAFQKRHYIALWNMYRSYPAFREDIKRYLSGKGEYPYQIQVRTPLGIVCPTLYSQHDLLTVNEIFCRQDYFADSSTRVVVDIGSNIGISALYFMTRNNESRCYLFEPDTRNTEKLKLNLSGFESRYLLREAAVSDVSGLFRFGIESTGRYGGIGIETGEYTEVSCLSINEILDEIIAKEESIDVLKMDTEGLELRTLKAIEVGFLKRVKKIYLESTPKKDLYPETFAQRQYGNVCQLTNKIL